MRKVVAILAFLLTATPSLSGAALIAEQSDGSSTRVIRTTNTIRAHGQQFIATADHTLGTPVSMSDPFGTSCGATSTGHLRFAAKIPVGANVVAAILHDSARPVPGGIRHVYWGDLSSCTSFIPGNGMMTDYEMLITLPVPDSGGAGDIHVRSGETYHVLFGERDGWTMDAEFKTDANGRIYYQLFDDATSTPATTTPACVENCYSSVVFLPGMKGSVLKKGSDSLWPPTFYSNDVPQLALDSTGNSINEIQVDGILEEFYGTDIYSPFSNFLDSLVLEETINEWLPLAYDWRYMPEEILENGIVTPEGTMNIIAEIERVAAESKSGKVTIIAHSMGGLLGKAIIKRLQAEGKDNLIDSFVMVATPQLGTPQAAAVVLHGDEEGLGAGFVVDSSHARALAQNMPSAYNLLPSTSYFTAINEPVIEFSDADFTQQWRDFWGASISTYSAFEQFITGQGVPRTPPAVDVVRIPEVIQGSVLDKAETFHNSYDGYVFPEHIRVVQVAGWGRPTLKAVKYDTSHFLQNYEPLFTRAGDRTVVYPSATASVEAGETYFFNLNLFRDIDDLQLQHRDIMNASNIQDLLLKILQHEDIDTNEILSTTSPRILDLDDQIFVSTHSPVLLGAYDQNGKFTGVDPNQDLASEVLSITEDIPGSTFIYFGDTQQIFLPKIGTYTFVYKGTGIGPTTVRIGSYTGDESISVAQFSDIPTTVGTNAIFEVSSDTLGDAVIALDTDGDNIVDENISKDETSLSVSTLIALIKDKVLSLNGKDKLKQSLIKRVESLEKKIEIKKQKNIKVLASFKQKMTNLALKGKIGNADATEIAVLLELLEAQSDTTVLDLTIIAQLREKISNLNIKTAPKSDLMKRVSKLESKQALVNAITNLTRDITKKALNGKISDGDTRALIDILSQIENAI